MTVPLRGSNNTGDVSLYLNGTPIEAVVWPAGFCLSIFSTGMNRFWQFAWIPVDEPLTNQMWWPATALQAIWPVCTTLSKMTSQRSSVWPGCVEKLMLVLNPLG